MGAGSFGVLMEFLQLVYFCSAAETENFAETARKFDVPPASISQSIKRLEKDIGVELFDRTKSGVKLNEFGRIWYNSSKTSLAALEDAKKKIHQEELKGTVRLLVLTNRFLVNDAIGSFLQKHKEVHFIVDYYIKDNYDAYDLIVTDNVDGSYELNKYKSSVLLDDDLVLACHKDSPLAEKEDVLIRELKGQTFVTLSENSGLFFASRRICNKGMVALNSVFKCDDPQSVVNYIDMGIGIGIVPKQAWKNIFTENIRLKKLLYEYSEHLGKKRTVLIRAKRRYLTRVVQVFMQELQKTSEKYIEEKKE